MIKLVVELERTLANFSQLAGERPGLEPVADEPVNGYGPAVPGISTDAGGEQEDVDALLAGMGM